MENRMSDNAIELSHLNKTFRSGRKRYEALRDVSFSVSRGEAFGFIGPNGAGKSTTIKIILDLIRADSGTAYINGINSRDALSRKGVVFMPENPYLNEYLTPLEVVKLGVQVHGIKVGNLDAYCMEWLAKFGMSHASGKKIRQMSKGMAQRTGLAHCLACKPEILILDEPLSGLDPVGRVDVVDLLVEYHAGGGTLLFTSHVLHDVERVANRFALINSGLITDVKTQESLLVDSKSYKITIHTDLAPAGYFSIGSGRFMGIFNQQEMWQQLKNIEFENMHLVSVVPELNLEKLFIDSVKAS
jgi:ABC-2 type transport system ATP-binding protein